MTVVNPKSISGINSITTGSGSDNLLTIHTSDASSTERVRINSSGDVIVGSGVTVSPDGNIFATGVTTSTTFVGALTGNVTGTASGNAVLTGSTNNTLVTVTGANAITGESTLTYDGTSAFELQPSSATPADCPIVSCSPVTPVPICCCCRSLTSRVLLFGSCCCHQCWAERSVKSACYSAGHHGRKHFTWRLLSSGWDYLII